MNAQKNIKQSKIDELESIRGIAALVVVLSHVPAWSLLLHSFPIFRNAYLMVDLFFVLSGFVICKAYASKIDSFTQMLRFQFLRFGRLYPVHLTFLLIYLGIECIKYFLQMKYGISGLNKQAFSDNNAFAFMKELLLIQAFWPNQEAIVFNGPAWSISAEFYTYLIFGLIVLLAKQFKFYVFAGISLISILLMLTFDFYGYDFMIRCLTGFFIGCLVSHVINNKFFAMLKKPLIIYSLICLIFLFAAFTNIHNIWNVLMYPMTGLLIIAIVITNQSGEKTILSSNVLVWLGKISFSLYMSHSAVLWFYSQTVRFVFKRPENRVENVLTPSFSNLEGLILTIGFLVVAMIVAYLTFVLIENPFRKYSRKMVGLSS